MTKPRSDDSKIDLNPPALEPAADAPWRDDALQRQGIASELDSLVAQLAGGAESASIALDGGYGTGKTFILQRWVQEMQGSGQVAVYYNAWENDCDDDPLVSLIETLTSNDKTGWGKRSVRALNAALTGVVRKYTGVDAQKALEAGKDQTAGLLEAARSRRESRQELKGILKDLVEATQANEVSGVVVVIDELDRCRPTFANELMERVKHVMSVPGLVFVFGVNILALRETVKAVYGNIDAHQYLLRMFTTTFHMPPGVFFSRRSAEPGGAYLQALADRHGLRAFCERHSLLREDLSQALRLLRIVLMGGGLTPRELERVVWLLSRVGAASLDPSGKANVMLPYVLVPLAIARVKNPDAYYETVSRPDKGPAVINCFFELIQEDTLEELDRRQLNRLEMTMYRVCHEYPLSGHASEPPAYLALHEIAAEKEAPDLAGEHLARRSTRIAKEQAETLLKAAPGESSMVRAGGTAIDVDWTFATLRYITSRFDVVWPRA